MPFDIDMRSVSEMGRKLGRFGPIFSVAERKLQEDMAEFLIERIRSYASGRPGPNIRTGAYRQSWNKTYLGMLGGYRVSTSAPQARRLEYGFVGTDSIGRHYHQPPFPHIRPAVADTRPEYAKRYAALPARVWRML